MYSYLQRHLNNFKNQVTRISLNEIFCKLNIYNSLELLLKFSLKDFIKVRQLNREQVEDSLIFINVIIKVYYNKSHKPFKFSKKNISYFRLH